ncbi:cobalt-precorrin-5B (C(1))-methyltransferase CbiD [Butyrivibrio sp. DSM 10294]|uniref:cobalt-precorrin-5B (C(1))-methyltransferase CbiD n=1 Tax=Butyrivibrio sp. DSM 10294 TaxID=2972457 RepID=UPI00234EAB18|nr:cobalt-precorrin-5B (C(1))-methyltransferase CbiD [Butyrivibrio sp. DSM 10294]MDC7294530.1 cobalt-precorrin-5B (C(1))-methyltransferase CbiD [Butyrivibrio sp. DSM 10294]
MEISEEGLFIVKGDKRLRCGFTTGSCAAAASKAALIMLITGSDIHNVSIMTPKGIAYNAEITDIERDEAKKTVSCAVIKDGGDDPDVTAGSKVFATVELVQEPKINIDGGEGVGRVTKPGMDQPVGNAAINSVPRKMIRESLEAVLEKYDMTDRGVRATISVPGGKELAEKTFNPKLGIVGGISILGTTGIVEPMSDTALLDTIRTEISVRRAEGRDMLMAAPGNYGLTFLQEVYGIDENDVVMSSNFICDTVKMAAEAGLSRLLFAGHIGKLVKVAGGIKNTHSMYGDHRMEILAQLSKECLDEDKYLAVKDRILNCVMTDEAVGIINETGRGEAVFRLMAEKIREYLETWSESRVKAEVIVFSKENTELVATAGAHEWIKEV